MSEIIVQGGMAKPSAQQIVEVAGIKRTHAYDILAGRQKPSLTIALRIYDATGAQFGLLEGVTKDTIEDLRPKAAA
jgi:DNA-binding phage protein